MQYVKQFFLTVIFLLNANLFSEENAPAPASPAAEVHDAPKAVSRAVNYLENGSFEFGIDKGWKAFEARVNQAPLLLDSENIVITDETVNGSKYLKFQAMPKDKEKRFFLVSRPFALKEKAAYTVRFTGKSVNAKAKCTVRLEKYQNGPVPEADRKEIPAFEMVFDKIPAEWSLLEVPMPDINPDVYVLNMEISISHSNENKEAALCLDAVQVLSSPSEETFVTVPCEFDIEPAFSNGIMLRNELGFLKIAAYNYTDENISREVFLTINDFYGREVSTEKYKFDRINGFSEKTIALPSLPVGLYFASLKDKEGNVFAEKSFAVLPVAQKESNAGAFCYNDKFTFGSLKKAGVDFIALQDMPDYQDYKRDQLSFGGRIQPKNIESAQKTGCEFIGILYMPMLRGKKLSEEDLENFSSYVKAIFAIYNGKVKYWRLMDDPYMDNCSPEDYAKLLKAVNQAVRSGFPDMKIIGPACSSTSANWIEAFIQTGALYLLDVFTVTGYGADDKAFDQLKKWAWADGKKRPIWDIGFGVIQSKSSYAPIKPSLDAPHRIKTCSAIVKALVWRHKAGIDKIFCKFYDRGPGWSYNQMLETDGELKPEAVAYSAASNMMTGSQFIKEINIGKVQCYVFKNKTRTFAVLWNTEAMDDDETRLLLQPQEMIYNYLLKQRTALKNKSSSTEAAVLNLPLKQNKGVDVKDMLGNNIKVEDAQDGTINLKLKYEPVFIFSEMNPQIFTQTLERSRISLPDGSKITAFASLKPFMDKSLISLSIKISNMTSQTLYPELLLKEIPEGITLMGNESVDLTLNAFEEKEVEFLFNPERNVFEKVSVKYEITEGKKTIKKDFKFSLIRAIPIDGSFAMKCDTAYWPPFETPMKIDHIGQLAKGNDYWNGPEDLSQTAGVFYNDEYLYILTRGVSPAASKPAAPGNSFDIFFDTDLKDIRYSTRNLDDYMITFFPAAESGTGAMFRTSSFKDENMAACINSNGNEFTGEFRFSRKALNIQNKNSLIRFDMNINKFSADELEPLVIMSWSGSACNSVNTEGYGYLMVGP